MFPNRSPDAALLRALRSGLRYCGYTEPALCERLGRPTLHEYARGDTSADPGPARDALDVLLRLFMEGRARPRSELAAHLPAGVIAALEGLELIGAVPDADGLVAAVVALYPTEGLYIASDLFGEFPEGRADSVYPAISKSGAVYMSALPRRPCEHFLELCSGTGIAALVAARTAGHAWAVDITERSTAFARFNAALNDVRNFTALQGDLYAPVAGLRFDRIVAHPPYVPALEQHQIFRDGGTDGEQITRRVIAEAPAFLRPGGQLYCTCVATERHGLPLEQRVRLMLGDASDALDVLVLATALIDPLVHFVREVALERSSLAEAAACLDTFQRLEIDNFVGCTIVVERHASPRPPLTLRRKRGVLELGESVDSVLRWEAFAREAAAGDRLAAIRPRLAPGAQLRVVHVPHEHAWALQSCHVTVAGALPVELQLSAEAATFLAWCDGMPTVREHLDRLVEQGLAPADAPPEAFYGMVLALLREGVLQAERPEAAALAVTGVPAAASLAV